MKKVMSSKEIAECIKKMSQKILVKNRKNLKELIIVGIRTRGVYIAERIANEIKQKINIEIPRGVLDITLYRDDVNSIAHQPLIKETKIPQDLTGKVVILVDDVLFTGRSIRAAMDELMDFGRPKRIELAVLIDRGHRELPIHPNYVGKKIKTKLNEKIKVHLKEVDNEENVIKYET